MNKKTRLITVLQRLKKVFPEAKCELNFENPFQLMVAVQLSAQCTDARVNLITPRLFMRVKNWHDLASISQQELEVLVFSGGFYRNKSRNLINAAQMVLSDFGGVLPQNIVDMVKIPGVARKTANVVLETGFGIVEGIVVDTHVRRVSVLLGVTKESNAEKIERDLMSLLPREMWGSVGHLLVWHGRRTCIARRPQCDGCAVADVCEFSWGCIKSRS